MCPDLLTAALRLGGYSLIPARCSLRAGDHVSPSGLAADHVEQQDGGAVEGERRAFNRQQERLSGRQQPRRGTAALTLAHAASERRHSGGFRCFNSGRFTCGLGDTWPSRAGSSRERGSREAAAALAGRASERGHRVQTHTVLGDSSLMSLNIEQLLRGNG